MVQYIGGVSVVAFVCSAIFWALASGAIAVSGKTKRPLLHLFLGAALHFIWFFVTCILAIIALTSKKQTEPQQIPITPTLQDDPWKDSW